MKRTNSSDKSDLKTATFQVRINPEYKSELEQICDKNGYSLTDAVNMLFAQMKIAGGLPFMLSAENSAYMQKKAEERFFAEMKKGFDSGEREGWISEEDVYKRFGIVK